MHESPEFVPESHFESHGLTIDFGRQARNYAEHRAGFPDVFFDDLAARGVLAGVHDALDLGTGTGTVARGLSGRLPSRARVVALDRSEALLAAGRELPGGASVEFRHGVAEEIPFADASFDLVSAGQSFHWFARDTAAAESKRVALPGAHFVLARFDFLPFAGSVTAATLEVIRREISDAAARRLTTNSYDPASVVALCRAGWDPLASYQREIEVPYSSLAWRSRILASHSVGGAITDAAHLARFDRALAARLADEFGLSDERGETMRVPHRVWTFLARA